MILGRPDPPPVPSEEAEAALQHTPAPVVHYLERVENYFDYIDDIRGEPRR